MGEHLKTHVASMPWVKCPAKNLTTPLGESGQTSLGKFIIEYIRVWPPSSWSLLHFHLRIRVRPQMLTKLVGEWLCMLVSVHYFHVGSEFSFQWPQTDNSAQWLGNRPRMYFPDAPAAGPHLGSKPLNTPMVWIKHDFVSLGHNDLSYLQQLPFTLPIYKELQVHVISMDVPFRTLTMRWKHYKEQTYELIKQSNLLKIYTGTNLLKMYGANRPQNFNRPKNFTSHWYLIISFIHSLCTHLYIHACTDLNNIWLSGMCLVLDI